MTRRECLKQAMECVLQDRNSQYGEPEDSFGMIAGMWTAYLGVAVDKVDVAMMMGLLKIARAKANPGHADSFVDLAGYAACGAECAAGKRQAEGCEELVQKDAPQTPQELIRHIVDCNPATFKPRTPTGEELAEMAEEDGNG